MDTSIFFNELFEGEIRFRCLKKGNKTIDIMGSFNEEVNLRLGQANENNYNIYFVVNSGGYKGCEITKINAVFIDLDCGRDEKGNYFDLNRVKKFKDEKWKQLQKFKFPYSYIVETRNGFHVYWFLKPNATIEQFIECQIRLINYFNSDEVIKNPARLMRVPGFYWCKYKDNKFLVKIIDWNEVRYDIQELINDLPEVNNVKSASNREEDIYYSLLLTQNTNILNLIKQQKVKELQKILKPQEVLFSSHEEVYDYLKKQNLHQFLGLYGSPFKCIFHDDYSPSASIFINQDTGHYIYKCHSSSCGFLGTIIEVTEKLTGLSKVKALRLLRKVYQVRYEKTEWQREKLAILEENQRVILSNDFENLYPELYKRVKNYLPLIYLLNDIAKEHLQTEYFSDKKGNPLFFASLRFIASLAGKDTSRLTDTLNVLVYLGLINKLPDEQIPESLLNSAKHEAAKRGKINTVNFYSIPCYDDNLLSFANQKSIEFKEKGFTMKGWSRELILRTLGEEEANRIYPKMNGKPINDASEELTLILEKSILHFIEQKGFTTEKEVMFNIQGFNHRVKERQIKKVLPEILEKYNLEKRRLNKELSEKYKIYLKGSPYIIYREENILLKNILGKGAKEFLFTPKFKGYTHLKMKWVKMLS